MIHARSFYRRLPGIQAYLCWREKRRAKKAWLAWARSPHIATAKTHFFDLYTDLDGIALSKKARDQFSLAHPKYIYGEIVFLSFAKILEWSAPKPGEVFYDLGSGTGKAVITAALLFPFSKTIGIEVLSILHQASCEQKKKLVPFLPKLNEVVIFLCADFLTRDLSDAGVIFINATSFLGAIWDNFLEKLPSLSLGTRVITVSKKITHDSFNLLYSTRCAMSWGYASIFIYCKIK
jgi:precorrin-6B methylase 2